jgi:hypothetical protein
MTRLQKGPFFAAVWLIVSTVVFAAPAGAEEAKIDTLQAMFERLKSCWRPPALTQDEAGMQITVSFSLTRYGQIFGKPRITYESEYASDDERLRYRTAVAETLQRCTPMPFTEGLGNAVAGRPLRIRFDARRTKSTEMRPWQTTKIL